ncbi:hypothetical protein ACOJBO_09835 [Rhizobium beringeri]
MTVIVYDRKRELMIADSRATSGSHHPIGAKRKINRIAAGPLKGRAARRHHQTTRYG